MHKIDNLDYFHISINQLSLMSANRLFRGKLGEELHEREKRQRILNALITLSANQLKAAFFIVLALSALVVKSLWPHIPHDTLILWFILTNIFSVIRYGIFAMEERGFELSVNQRAFIHIFAAGWSGIMWGTVGVYFSHFGPPSTMQFISILLFGITTSALPVLSPVILSYVAFSFPVMAGLAYRYFSVGNELNDYTGIFCIFFLLVNLVLSFVTHWYFRQSYKLRYENEDLIKDLKKERDKAVSAHEAKSKFLASASHDLRQPLTAMGFFIAALKTRIRDKENLELLAKVNKTSQNLKSLLDGLLDLSKIEAGIFKPQREALSLARLFMDLKKEFSPAAENKDLIFKCFTSGWVIDSDHKMLRRILSNLLTNAIQYTGQGQYTRQGKILLGCRKKGNNIRIEIHDTGVGIAEEFQEDVFTEYYQVSNPERDRKKGLGLGLSVVKGLCYLLDHKLEMRTNPGRGTSIYLTIPLSEQPISHIIEYKNTPQDTPSPTHQTKNIILIDDDAEILESMSGLIEQWGYETASFEDEFEALKYLKTHDFIPDLIIADFRLKGNHTGADAIKAINDYYKLSIPAVIITGDTAKDRLIQAQESGHTLLHKPIKPAKLRSVISYILHQQKKVLNKAL